MVVALRSLVALIPRCFLQYDVSDIPSRGWAGQNDPKQVAERIIQDFDKDGDKELTKQEFLDG